MKTSQHRNRGLNDEHYNLVIEHDKKELTKVKSEFEKRYNELLLIQRSIIKQKEKQIDKIKDAIMAKEGFKNESEFWKWVSEDFKIGN